MNPKEAQEAHEKSQDTRSHKMRQETYEDTRETREIREIREIRSHKSHKKPGKSYTDFPGSEEMYKEMNLGDFLDSLSLSFSLLFLNIQVSFPGYTWFFQRYA